MDILYELEEATAQQVLDRISDPPSYSSIRTLLRKLEEKQHINHREESLKYVYFPLVERQEASRNAIDRLVRTFFSGSPGRAANALLDMSAEDLSEGELEALEKLIHSAKQNSRKNKRS